MQAHAYSPETNPIALSLGSEPGSPLDHLLHSKSRILRSKLEVLATEIQARLAIWDRNLTRINDDKSTAEGLLSRLAHLTRYHLSDPREQTRLQEAAFHLESQRRAEDVESWRDVVNVMRDFLEVWEAHEQARTRAIFLNHVGPTTQDPL